MSNGITEDGARIQPAAFFDWATGEPSAGGSGGGDASAANQVLIIDALNDIIADESASIVVGGTAADAALTAAPVTMGGLAKNTNPTKVADGDVVNTRHDLTGRIINVPHQQRDLHGDETSTFTSTTSAATIVSAEASTFRDLISLTITNTSATATLVEVYNDDGTTVRWRGYSPAGQMTGIVFPVPLKQTTVNHTWKAKTVTSVASVYITAQFLKNV